MVDLIIFTLIALVAYILQMQVATIPFMVGIVVVLFILYRLPWVFLVAFIFGILFDGSHLAPIGLTSLLLVTLLFLVSLYERKFEIRTYYFVFFSTLFGSVFFLIFQKESYVIQESLISAVFSVLWYRIGLRVVSLRSAT